MSNSALALKAQSLTKRFDRKTVFEDLSFSVNRGETFGLLGAPMAPEKQR